MLEGQDPNADYPYELTVRCDEVEGRNPTLGLHVSKRVLAGFSGHSPNDPVPGNFFFSGWYGTGSDAATAAQRDPNRPGSAWYFVTDGQWEFHVHSYHAQWNIAWSIARLLERDTHLAIVIDTGERYDEAHEAYYKAYPSDADGVYIFDATGFERVAPEVLDRCAVPEPRTTAAGRGLWSEARTVVFGDGSKTTFIVSEGHSELTHLTIRCDEMEGQNPTLGLQVSEKKVFTRYYVYDANNSPDPPPDGFVPVWYGAGDSIAAIRQSTDEAVWYRVGTTHGLVNTYHYYAPKEDVENIAGILQQGADVLYIHLGDTDEDTYTDPLGGFFDVAGFGSVAQEVVGRCEVPEPFTMPSKEEELGRGK